MIAVLAAAGMGGVNPLEILMWRADVAIAVMDGIGKARGQRSEVSGQSSEDGWMEPGEGVKAIGKLCG